MFPLDIWNNIALFLHNILNLRSTCSYLYKNIVVTLSDNQQDNMIDNIDYFLSKHNLDPYGVIRCLVHDNIISLHNIGTIKRSLQYQKLKCVHSLIESSLIESSFDEVYCCECGADFYCTGCVEMVKNNKKYEDHNYSYKKRHCSMCNSYLNIRICYGCKKSNCYDDCV